MNVSDTLNKAADLIEERGWQHGAGWPTVGRNDSELCLEGGIMAALGMNMFEVDLEVFWECPSYRAVESYLGLEHAYREDKRGDKFPTNPLWGWNDQHGTAERVVETLRATAVIEAAREDAALLAEAGRA